MSGIARGNAATDARRVRVRARLRVASIAAIVLATVAPVSALALTPQSISFDLPAADVVGSVVDVSATATSGLTVTLAVDTPSTCAVAAAQLTLLAAGTCTVTASQPGDSTWAGAPNVVDSMTVNNSNPPPFDPQPQTITFTLPPSGYVGGTVALAATASSGLDVEYASLTPSICLTDGSTLALDAVGTCTVRATQPGTQDDWLPAPPVDATLDVKLPPYVTSDGANLGRYALNGPIQSMAIDPATGIAYVGGSFTEIGVRSGSVALVNGPDTGTDTLRSGSPDVIGSELKVFPDDATGYFVTGHIGSVNGDGVHRDIAARFTMAGAVDATWAIRTTCGTTLPNWAKFGIQWDLGDVLVTNIGMASSTAGDSTVGLGFIDKATGVAKRTGGGNTACGSGSRLWPATPVFGPLASCNGWLVCSGGVIDVTTDAGSNSLITAVLISRGKTIQTQEPRQTWLIAYDLTTGARRWATRLEAATVPTGMSPSAWGATVRQIGGLGGSILLSGEFPMESAVRPTADLTSTMLLSAATGTILQRWNSLGEQNVADPLGDDIGPTTPCTPVSQDWATSSWRFASRSTTHAVGYGQSFVSGGEAVYPVCDYSVIGTGLAARLASSSLGVLSPSRSPSAIQPLPSTMYAGHILVGPFDAYDLDAHATLSWHPGPSSGDVSLAVAGAAVVIGGEASFLKGIPALSVAALDDDLSPKVGFESGLSANWFRGLALDGDQIVVVGELQGPAGPSHLIVLDKATGAVEWTAPSAPLTFALSVAVDPGDGAIYAGFEGNSGPALRRYARAGNGFVLDAAFHPSFGGIDGDPAITGLAVIDGRLYVGGSFESIDGQPRQGAARFDANGLLDSWAPRILDELHAPAGAGIDLQMHGFLEVGDKVVVTGQANQLVLDESVGGYLTTGLSAVLVYTAGTGALVRPLDGRSWFGETIPYPGQGLAEIDGVIYVALEQQGIAAFDATTFDYLPYLSVRTFPGWGSNAIYAIAARPSSGSPSTQIAAATSSTNAGSLVIGGEVPTWKNHTTSNVLELGPGALNSDHAAPVVKSVSGRPHAGAAVSGSSVPWTATWSATDSGGSGVARYELAASRNGGSYSVISVNLKTATASVTLRAGSTYRFRVRGIDRAGNVGAWVSGSTFKVSAVSQASASVHYTGRWVTATSATTWWGGTAKASSTRGSTVSYTFTGKSIAWVGLRGLGRGKASVYINGVLKATVDLYSATTRKQLVIWSSGYTTSAKRNITIKVLGTAGRPRVDVDGFIVGT